MVIYFKTVEKYHLGPDHLIRPPYKTLLGAVHIQSKIVCAPLREEGLRMGWGLIPIRGSYKGALKEVIK